MIIDVAQGKPKMLGERLLESGVLTPTQLKLALAEQRQSGGMLGDILERLGFVGQETLSHVFALDSLSEFVDLEHRTVEPEILRLVPAEFARKNKLLPLVRDHGSLLVAMADTFDVLSVDHLEKMTGLRVKVVAASAQAILDAVDTMYAQTVTLDQLVESTLFASATNIAENASNIAPMIRLVDHLIIQGFRDRATDIHIEPDEAMVRVRYRIDGLLQQAALLPKALQSAIEARIKVMAGLDVTERRLPQDGRIAFKFGHKDIDLRVSSLPTQFGESLVLRVLDRRSSISHLESLGFFQADLDRLVGLVHRSHGIILVTGPTGSGKTTTIYASMAQMDAHQRSIFTLEDPVEYRLPQVRQTQVNAEIGMGFSNGLRALLRQDPDVILVGEIRDEETAQLATRAALTGHLVLSTLHTNSALGAVPRLINMGVEPYLLASALVGVLAQRLVRKICPECAVEDVEGRTLAQKSGWDIPCDAQMMRGNGCKRCRGTGFEGRLGIFEVLSVNEELGSLFRPGISEGEISRTAKMNGFRTMMDDGMSKAFRGLTTFEEVIRVAG
jgi:type IV pilus assembly protein PilB